MVDERKISVIKRDGSREDLNLDKIHAILEKAAEGYAGVSISDIALKANLSFFDGISSKEIHAALIKSASDLISEENTDYQYVAANLLNYELRKSAWGSMNPPRLYDHVKKMVEDGYYTHELTEFYTEEDFDKMELILDHDKDFNFTFIGLTEYLTKYCIRDRTLKELVPLETPQWTYILAAALSCLDNKSLKDIKSKYNDFSDWNISLPTPIMAGLRSPVKQFSSCTLISCGDNLNSITETNTAIIKYASKKAGIGIDASRIRAEGDKVGKGGSTKHTGVIPFLRSFEGALKSSAQGGIRGSSATTTLCIWHYEILDLLVLKNNKGTPDSRVRKMDYSFQINNYLYNRLIDGKDITLFSPSEHETPGLYESYFKTPEKFIELYEKYEKDPAIKKKVISAYDLFSLLMTERKETGRIYIFNVDNVNQNSTYKEKITMSNLCQEVTQNAYPLASYEYETYIATKEELFDIINKLNEDVYVTDYKLHDCDSNKIKIDITRDKGLIALCTLAAINLGNIKKFSDLERICYNAISTLDNLLDYQDYMHPAAKRHTLLYRPLGVGITNLAYYLAKNNLKYSDQAAYEFIHETMEAISYYLIKASVQLAKEKGKCLGFENTTWADGILPIDRYNKNVDEIVNIPYKMDWESLRSDLLKYGIRNATTSCMMPAESSSRIFNSTNGVEPVRALITTKVNKEHITKQVVPEYKKLKNKYDLLWNMKDQDGIIKMMATIQKFTDQSISTNLSYNPLNYDNGEIPMSTLIGDILKYNYYGGKCLYYNNLKDGSDDLLKAEPEQPLNETHEDIPESEDCDSCKI